jgi:hypothetical protein
MEHRSTFVIPMTSSKRPIVYTVNSFKIVDAYFRGLRKKCSQYKLFYLMVNSLILINFSFTQSLVLYVCFVDRYLVITFIWYPQKKAKVLNIVGSRKLKRPKRITNINYGDICLT